MNTPADSLSRLAATVGLTSAEAERRLGQYGSNEIRERHPHQFLILLRKFWGRILWMLEATILIQLILGRRGEAAIVALLLVVNIAISFIVEGRANNALALALCHSMSYD